MEERLESNREPKGSPCRPTFNRIFIRFDILLLCGCQLVNGEMKEHKHKIEIYSKKPFCASVDPSWLTCEQHNPHMRMDVPFLEKALKAHPEWFEITGVQMAVAA